MVHYSGCGNYGAILNVVEIKIMADKKNIVIRVNYPKHENKSEKRSSAPEMITVWHVNRIVLAVVVLGLLFALPFFLINHEDQYTGDSSAPITQKDKDRAGRDKKPIEYTEFEEISSVPPVETDSKPAQEEVEPLYEITPAPDSLQESDDQEAFNNYQSSINDKRVSRALLTTGINNKDPIDEFTPPVKIGHNQKVVLYYFTELKNSKYRALYHEWLHNGQVVAKRQLYIGGDHWRNSSKMTFSEKNKGYWLVRLVDKSGQILSQKGFSVVLEE